LKLYTATVPAIACSHRLKRHLVVCGVGLSSLSRPKVLVKFCLPPFAFVFVVGEAPLRRPSSTQSHPAGPACSWRQKYEFIIFYPLCQALLAAFCVCLLLAPQHVLNELRRPTKGLTATRGWSLHFLTTRLFIETTMNGQSHKARSTLNC
jgi:hypothetical protein